MSVAAPSSSFWIDFEEARNAVETIVDVAHDEVIQLPILSKLSSGPDGKGSGLVVSLIRCALDGIQRGS